MIAVAAMAHYSVLNGLNNLQLDVRYTKAILAIILLQTSIAIIISKYLQLVVMLLDVVVYINLINVILAILLVQKKLHQQKVADVFAYVKHLILAAAVIIIFIMIVIIAFAAAVIIIFIMIVIIANAVLNVNVNMNVLQIVLSIILAIVSIIVNVIYQLVLLLYVLFVTNTIIQMKVMKQRFA